MAQKQGFSFVSIPVGGSGLQAIVAIMGGWEMKGQPREPQRCFPDILRSLASLPSLCLSVILCLSVELFLGHLVVFRGEGQGSVGLCHGILALGPSELDPPVGLIGSSMMGLRLLLLLISHILECFPVSVVEDGNKRRVVLSL